jgi:carboxypeptidase Taq
MTMSYENYKKELRKIADINYAAGLLTWDQETYMPPKSASFRAQQLSTLAGISHQLSTSTDLEKLLKTLISDKSFNDEQKRNILESFEQLTDRKKYTTEFVQELSKTASEAFQAWQAAKQNDDFSIYAPNLEKMVELKKQECEILGYKDHPYDALLNQYEPKAKTADIDILFKDVKAQLVDFVKEISSRPQNNDDFMFKKYEAGKQWDFSLYLLKQMGFDFEAGRQDKSTHPFTIHFNPLDVRVTTRTNENDLSEIIWSTIHEGGHALYEQGIKPENYGLPAGEYTSLGIHESQSRFWENNIGRSLNYWKFNFPKLQNYFPDNLKNVSAKDFYKAMNIVKPSLIRTNSDELTYHFHIMIRFELEKALIEGNIKVKDLPGEWNTMYKNYLNIDVPSDSKGVLQDIHWSHGSIGYFPTYSLGSFYAAQFHHQAKKEMPGMEEKIASGDLSEILDWLRKKIHVHGRLYSAEEICINLTGEKLNFKYFMDYAKEKYGKLYGK